MEHGSSFFCFTLVLGEDTVHVTECGAQVVDPIWWSFVWGVKVERGLL